MTTPHLAFPFRIAGDGRLARAESIDDLVRSEIIQLLLTNPGERAFVPRFGGGIRRLVFEGNDSVTVGLVKSRISQALTHWLSERVEVIVLEVTAEEATLTVDLSYRNIATGSERQLRFEHLPG